MSAEADLVVDSATGVDVSLPVAGPGARSYAFVIDWHIRVVLFLAWYVIGVLIYNRSWSLTPPDEPNGIWYGLIVLPALCIYLLYHPVLETVMRGRTPGKRLAGVRIVTRHGSPPSITAHLIRNVFRLIDQFPAFYPLGLVMVLVTRDHVRIGDLAAGTLLVYDRRDETALEHLHAAVAGRRIDAQLAELVSDVLQRWDVLEPPVRRKLARSLLSRTSRAVTDAELDALDDGALRQRLQSLASGAPE